MRLLHPLRHRNFALLWVAQSVSLFGDGVYMVAIAWQVYELSNSPTALGLVGIAWALPFLAVVLVGGVVTDRVDRRRVMIAGDVIRAVAMAAMAVLALTGATELWHVLALAAFYALGDALFVPAFGAIVPDLVPRTLIVEANAIDQLMRPVAMQLAGPALGGLVVAGAGVGTAFALDAVTFVVSGVALLLMRTPAVEVPATTTSTLDELRAGLRFVRSQNWLLAALLSGTVVVLVMWGPWEVLLPFLVKNELQGDAGDLGLVFAAGGLGSVLAAIAMAQRGEPRRPVLTMYLFSAVGILGIAGYAFARTPLEAMGVAFVVGGLSTVANVIWITLTHTRVPRALRGRVASLASLATFGLLPISYAITGPVATLLDTRPTLLIAGVLGAVVTVAFLLVPGATAPDHEAVPADDLPTAPTAQELT